MLHIDYPHYMLWPTQYPVLRCTHWIGWWLELVGFQLIGQDQLMSITDSKDPLPCANDPSTSL